MKKYLKRLIPAAHATAMVAALVHIVGIGLLTGIALELVYIGILSYVISLVVGIVVGAVLLTLVGVFRLGPKTSLLLFIAAAQLAVIGLSMYFFETEFGDIIWVYSIISIPPTITAWYFSVYHVWKAHMSSASNEGVI